MRPSGIVSPKENQFDHDQWLVHLVNTKSFFSSIFSGGHAAIIVEGLEKGPDGDEVVVHFYDINAMCASGSWSANEPFSYITNVRMMTGRAAASDPKQVKRLYHSDCIDFETGRCSFQVSKAQALALEQSVFKDQKRTVRAIARSFLRTARFTKQAAGDDSPPPQLIDPVHYFQCLDDLHPSTTGGPASAGEKEADADTPPVKADFHQTGGRGGPSGIYRFLENCEAIRRVIENDGVDPAILRRICSNFLIMMNKHNDKDPTAPKGFRTFFLRNLKRLHRDGLLFTSDDPSMGFLPFKLTGERLSADRKTREEQDDEDHCSNNCISWCRAHLEGIGLDVSHIGHNKPKKIVSRRSVVARTDDPEPSGQRATCALL